MPSEQGDQLVTALRRAAHDLVHRRSIRDLEEVLGEIVAAAVQTVPGADDGGVTMTERGQITSRRPTTDTIHKLDQTQVELHEGPCISAAEHPPENGMVLARDLAAEPDSARWPRFAPYAAEAGYRSILSTQLSTNGGVRAALNLYSHEPDAFDDAARTLAGLFGVQAAILLYGVDHASHLNVALETRDVIGQAKGILMERFNLSDDQAFQMLVRSSQDTNMKLVDVARWLSTERHSTGRNDNSS